MRSAEKQKNEAKSVTRDSLTHSLSLTHSHSLSLPLTHLEAGLLDPVILDAALRVVAEPREARVLADVHAAVRDLRRRLSE